MVRVAARDLVPIRIARSSSLRLGDDVIAVGYPLGLGGPTVTSGIVSGPEPDRRAGRRATSGGPAPDGRGDQPRQLGRRARRPGRAARRDQHRGGTRRRGGEHRLRDRDRRCAADHRGDPQRARGDPGLARDLDCVRRVGRGRGRARARSLDARRPADGGLSGWAGRARRARARRRDRRARRRSDPVGADLDGGGCQARSRRPDRARGDRHGGAAARRADRDAPSSLVEAPPLATSRVRVLRRAGSESAERRGSGRRRRRGAARDPDRAGGRWR